MSTPTEIKEPVEEPTEVEKVSVSAKNETERHEHDLLVACGGGCPMTPPGN